MQDPLTKIKTTPDRRIGGGGGGGGGGTRGGTRGIKGSQIKELIYNDGGRGFGIKDGQTVDGASFYSKVWAGHKDHVHVAAGPKTTVRLGKLAQSMGCTSARTRTSAASVPSTSRLQPLQGRGDRRLLQRPGEDAPLRPGRRPLPAAPLMLAAASDIAEVAPWAFLVGAVIGFVIGARYRIEKRNGGDDGE
jgi:hypothetical protein